MRRRWNNLAGRGLMLVLLALFAVPCIACEDAIRWRHVHDLHDAVQTVQSTSENCGCTVHHTHEAPPCGCLSDTSKVLTDRPQEVSLLVDVVPAPVFYSLLDPPVVRHPFAEPVHRIPPLLVRPAVADRAPPAA